MTGVFITLEGGEGAGKSTQCRRLADRLRQGGRHVVETREPGGSPGAERLRSLLLEGGHGLSLRAETLVLFAARFDHIERTIAPALAAGAVVICDRFYDSTLAYQGYGLGGGGEEVLGFIRELIGLTPLHPALTLLLEVPRDVSRARLEARGIDPDRYERLDEAFHQRVGAGFRDIARRAPDRIVSIDAAAGPDQVAAALLQEVERRLPA